MANSVALIESGDIFLQDGEVQQAIVCYEKALTFSLSIEHQSRVRNNLGVAYKRLGFFQKAIEHYTKGIQENATYSAFYSNLASIYQVHHEYKTALGYLVQALNIDATATLFMRIIELCKLLKEPKRAFEYAQLAVKTLPKAYESHLLLGNLFSEWKQYAKAVECYQRAIALDSTKTQAFNNIGVAYKELEQFDLARNAYEMVLKLNPDDSAVYNNYGNLLRHCKETQKAIAYLEHSIKLNPTYADAYSNLGAIYKEGYRYQEARSYYQKALALNPEHVNAHFDLGLIELSEGNYDEGLRHYEYRIRMNELIAKIHMFKTPMWQGQPLTNKRLILQNEQGYGDNIMFIRYAEQFKALGAYVIVRTRPALMRLFESVKGIDLICSEEEAIVEHDYYLPVLSSAFYLKTDLKTIPARASYLEAHKELYPLPSANAAKKIGLVWSGSPTHKAHKERYVGLKTLSSLFDIESIQWHSLQLGDDAQEIEACGFSETLLNHADTLTDFAMTAALIHQLDLVITTDTSVAHLCGALGKEAWVMIPKHADWRWLQEGGTTPWYPSLRLFRQTHRGVWSDVVDAMKRQLEANTKDKNQ